MYKLHLKIDFIPESLNKKLRKNRYANNKENKSFDIYMSSVCMGKLPKVPLEKARLTLIRHSHRMLDFDGMVGSFKPVVDSLVSCGVLIDDRWSVLGKWDCDQIFRPKKEGQILEIIVEEV